MPHRSYKRWGFSTRYGWACLLTHVPATISADLSPTSQHLLSSSSRLPTIPIMSTPTRDDKKNRVGETGSDEYIEDAEKRDVNAKVDYSGAFEKTDPKEIALVKKLDWRIMVPIFRCLFVLFISEDASHSLCYGACTGSIIWIVMPSLLLDLTIWRKT